MIAHFDWETHSGLSTEPILDPENQCYNPSVVAEAVHSNIVKDEGKKYGAPKCRDRLHVGLASNQNRRTNLRVSSQSQKMQSCLYELLLREGISDPFCNLRL